ncbi:hypothetical protein CRUP_014482, partial [Coryphaenoides rupestris]
AAQSEWGSYAGHFFRLSSASLPISLLRLWQYASIPFHLVPLRVSWQCNLGAALLMAPQLYWFSLICRGALRLFTRSARRPPTSSPSPANGYSTRSVEAEPSAH